MSQVLLAANWKMNTDLVQVDSLVRQVLEASDSMPAIDYLICPPYVYLAAANAELQRSKVFLGAQDVSEYAAGAYTSQISAAMLADIGATHVIVGHSECRHILGHDNAVVAAKYQQALAAEITPILCVGETLAQREAGTTMQIVLEQLNAVLSQIDIATLPELIIAYEPVWAIGTGVTAKSSDVAEVHADILAQLAAVDASLVARTRILYGGSVKEGNAAELIKVDGVHGFLVGGASLTEEFIKIGEICNS